MRIYLVTYAEDGGRKYWHESLNARGATALAVALDRQGKDPEIKLFKADARTLVSALESSDSEHFRFKPPFNVAKTELVTG
jgi:hypothetical protein